MIINNHETNPNIKLVTNDKGDVYFVTQISCPCCKAVLYACSCADYLMGMVRRGKNPLDGCKHILFVKEQSEETVEEAAKRGFKGP